MTASTFLLGVDIGGTKIATLLVDQHGVPVVEYTAPTDISSTDATLNGIVDAIKTTVDQAHVDVQHIRAIGIGVPGQVNRHAGQVEVATNLNWRAIPIGPLLSSTFQVPCFLENDVRAATLGLLRYHYTGAKNLAYVSIGTGIAAGLVLQGKVYRGPRGMAGEIGHISVVENGPRCACGLHGCLEAMAAGPAIARMAEHAASTLQSTLLQTFTEPLSAHHVYAAAAYNDPAACAIRDRVGMLLARALVHLVMTCDISSIVLGGGVANAGVDFLESIRQALRSMQQDSQLIQNLLHPEQIELVPSGYHAGRWGAVAVAAQGLETAHFCTNGHGTTSLESTHRLPL